jgi:hypothetical protein
VVWTVQRSTDQDNETEVHTMTNAERSAATKRLIVKGLEMALDELPAGDTNREMRTLVADLQRDDDRTLADDVTAHFAYHVALVLDNEEPLYRHRRALVQEHLEARDPCPVCQGRAQDPRTDCSHCDGKGIVSRYPHMLGDRLKDWAEELAQLEGDDLSMMAREMLGLALGWTDWAGLADRYIAQELEEQNAEAGG